MSYTNEEVIQYVEEEDVKFIRLAFCDIYGRQKNISVLPTQLEKVFKYGKGIDASAIDGFSGAVHTDLFLHPDPSTIAVLPWRPEHGKVVRMFCDIKYPDGTPFEGDMRTLLKNAVAEAEKKGFYFNFGSELEFYLFKRDDNGEPTAAPYDNAGYMDIAPDDKGENIRREICLTLERMGIYPESSHHEEGPGQNEIDFIHSDPLAAADNAVTFKTVVNTVTAVNGLCADFSPRPIADKPGNGFHINISLNSDNNEYMPRFISGIMDKIKDMTLFLNPDRRSYERFGTNKAPKYITWSRENRSQLIRIPAYASVDSRRAELRSPDPLSNPYLAFALIIYACLESAESDLKPVEAVDVNLTDMSGYDALPLSFDEAAKYALESEFIKRYVPQSVVNNYANK